MGSQNDPGLVPVQREPQYEGMGARKASGLGRYAEQRGTERPAPVMPWSVAPWIHRIWRGSWLHTLVIDDIYIIHCMLWPHLFTAAPLAAPLAGPEFREPPWVLLRKGTLMDALRSLPPYILPSWNLWREYLSNLMVSGWAMSDSEGRQNNWAILDDCSHTTSMIMGR